jgi:acarbose 7IV-phosphotransferase
MNKSALVIGGVSWDTVVRVAALPDPRAQTLFSKDCYESVGGTGAGKALNLARLGWTTTLHCLLGDDYAGRCARAALEGAGIRLLAEPDGKGTERHTNLIADSGARLSIYTHYGTFEPDFDWSGLLAQALAHDVVIVNIANYARAMLRPLKSAGKEIWCDVHDWNGRDDYHRDFVSAADYLFMSSDNLPNWREALGALIAGGRTRLAVCTHGARGATAILPGGRSIEVPAVAVPEIVGSDGAGDAFMVGTLHGLLAGRPIEESLEFGALAGALCVQSRTLSSERLVAPGHWGG